MALLGLDIGTSGCKATIVDEQGNLCSQASREYPLISVGTGYQEINPETVWASVQETIRRSVRDYRGETPIHAIGISSFGETLVAVDGNGNTLGNSMIYTDIRGQEEALILERELGNDRVFKIAGTTVQPMYSICKLMWTKRNRPDIFAKVWKFLAFADFVMFKLGAEPHTDYSLAARTMAFNVTRKIWSDEILACAGIDARLLGEPVQAGTIVGRVRESTAAELGLPSGVLLVAGGHDQACAALGAGILQPGIAVDGLGTTECITPIFDRPILSAEMARSNFACVPHVLKDMYVTYGFIFTSGSILKWYRDNFASKLVREARRTGASEYELIISQAANKPSDLFLLPHFAGAATPYMDTSAQGAIVGLNIYTQAGDIIRAILEGITFEMMVNVERMEQAGIAIREIRAVGGLAKSETYLQLKADMMGKQVSSLRISEAGTLGVAVLAGKASGLFHSYDQAVSQLVKIKREYHPDPARRAFYAERYEKYKKLYPAVKSILGR